MTDAPFMRPLKPGEVVSAPRMQTIGSGMIVQKPDGQLSAPEVGPAGGLSIGAYHLPTVGPVFVMALHSREGETLCATLGQAGFSAFAILVNETAEAIERGDFNQPERKQ